MVGETDGSRAGRTRRKGARPEDFWVAGSKRRMVSMVLPRKSRRRGSSWAVEYRSTIPPRTAYSPGFSTRSEEHTSELQSRLHLVCRLLLEKKKKNIT